MINRKSFKGLALLIFMGALFSGLVVAKQKSVLGTGEEIKIGADKPPITNVDPKEFSKAFIEASKKVMPTIVQINVVVESKTGKMFPDDDFFKFFPFKDFGGGEPKQQEGSGSGVIISSDGYIITNNHVVEDAKKITVKLNDKREFSATVTGKDANSDLAVIKIDTKNLPVAYLGNSDDVEVGQWVMALGNPLSLSSTATAGIISAKHRKIDLKRDTYGIDEFLQTDAAINPGNSGGALIDLQGAVIGINAAIASQTGSYIGYGFAIPINLVKKVAKDLIKYGKVNRGFLGVSIGEVESSTAKAVGLDGPKGVMVQSVVTGGAGEKADIKEGDIILKVDGKDVNQPNELQVIIGQHSAGDKVKVTLWRDGKEIEKTVILRTRDNKESFDGTKKDSEEDNAIADESTEKLNLESIGISVKNMTEEEKKAYKIDSGVLITETQLSGKDAGKKIGPGLVIVQADRKDVKNVSELSKIVKSKKGSAVLLQLRDKTGNKMFVGVDVDK